MIAYFILAFFSFLVGIQICKNDFKLLFSYNYKIHFSTCITFIASVIALWEIFSFAVGIFEEITGLIIAILYSYTLEKRLAYINTHKLPVCILYRFCYVSLFVLFAYVIQIEVVFAFLYFGYYLRNCKYNVIYPNTFVLAKSFKRGMPNIFSEEIQCEVPEGIPDFSYAGNDKKTAINALETFNVVDFGIRPNVAEDQLHKLQMLIDKVGLKGGGRIFFPKGVYQFNKHEKKEFLQINYSNIVLEGEVDENQRPLVKLVNCGKLNQGNHNPWLSPFFITTGEKLQKSNIFWGLQFRKRKKIIMRSGSMSDPGSDGTILSPTFATNVIKTTFKGDDLLYVDDAYKITGRYILLGLYNTDQEASLLKDILGQKEIRPEWAAAKRAGEEEAPSYQWLVEVKEIVDKHVVRLIQPHRRDCDIRYAPKVYNVEMLENIIIRNLHLSSTWNGLFKHHGDAKYYTVAQAQEMDYGWNAINIKRVAHGEINNVIIDNFTNPLYVLDSRNVTVSNIVIKGNDGHQGIKVYEHACDNLFQNIKFYNHFADMMGGEGNMYGNVFSNIYYLNPCFKPVSFDFHGFSEGPMSPPSYNLFELIYGFDRIHSSGSIHMNPACGRTNVWWNCYNEGEKCGGSLFYSYYTDFKSWRYKLLSVKQGLKMYIKHPGGLNKIIFYTKEYYNNDIASKFMSETEHNHFYTDFYIYGMNTMAKPINDEENIMHIYAWNRTCKIKSLYEYQKNKSINSL